jgi:hypothetical protein
MRRIALLLLALALVLPAAAVAGRAAQGDGSLVVANADGTFTVQVKGVIFGHFDRGKMTVLDYKADNPNVLATVSGAKMDFKGAKANVVYSGKDVRFLFPSGSFTLRFEGAGIDLSAVGKGTLAVSGKTSPTGEDGMVAVNGAKPTPLPSLAIFGGSTIAVTASVEKLSDKTGNAGSSSGSSSNGRS